MTASLFFENASPGDEEIDASPGFLILRTDLLAELRKGPSVLANDLDVSLDLLNLASMELEKYGTDGTNTLDDTQIELVIKTFRSVLRRLDIELALPFRNFTTFRNYWLNEKMSGTGGWNARRQAVEILFRTTRNALDALEEDRLTKPLTNPVDEPRVSWPEVDTEVRELRRKFEAAVTQQDFRALGTNCIGTLEAVGRVVHDPLRDLRNWETELPYDRIKERLDRYIERQLSGSENEELRKAVKSVIALANRLKHRTAPSALMAGLAADSTILVTSMIRRISDPSLSRVIDDQILF